MNGNIKQQVGPRWKNKKSGKTYGKKAKKRYEKQKRAALAQQSNSPTFFDNTDTPDDGPLVADGRRGRPDYACNADLRRACSAA